MIKMINILLMGFIVILISSCAGGYHPQPGIDDTNGCSLMVSQGFVKAVAGIFGSVNVCKISTTGDCFEKTQNIDLDKLKSICEMLD